MVCKDLDVATDVSRSSDLNCVTMDGDQRDKKGTLTGGFIDSSRSRLAAMRAIKVPPNPTKLAFMQFIQALFAQLVPWSPHLVLHGVMFRQHGQCCVLCLGCCKEAERGKS